MSEKWLICGECELGDDYEKDYGAPICIIHVKDWKSLEASLHEDIRRVPDRGYSNMVHEYPPAIEGTEIETSFFNPISLVQGSAIVRKSWHSDKGRHVIYLMRLPQVWGWTPIADSRAP